MPMPLALFKTARSRASRERINAQVIFKPSNRLVAQADFTEAAHHDPYPVARGVDNKTVIWCFAIVTRWSKQVLPTRSLIGAYKTKVNQELEESIIGRAHHAGWNLDHRGTIDLQIEGGNGIYRTVIAS